MKKIELEKPEKLPQINEFDIKIRHKKSLVFV
jgi:hypothetical protein